MLKIKTLIKLAKNIQATKTSSKSVTWVWVMVRTSKPTKRRTKNNSACTLTTAKQLCWSPYMGEVAPRKKTLENPTASVKECGWLLEVFPAPFVTGEEEEDEEEEYLFRQKQKKNLNTNIIKHKGGFPERHTPIVLDTLSSASNIVKKERKRTLYNTLQQHVNEHTFMYQCH